MWLDSKAVNCPQKWGNFKDKFDESYLEDFVGRSFVKNL